MRTTLTLDSDIAQQLKQLAHQKKTSFKKIVNETLRAGLARGKKPNTTRAQFRVKASHCGFRSGIDLGKLNQLLDELDAEDFTEESRRGRA